MNTMTTPPKIHRPTATTLLALAALAVIATGCVKTAVRKGAAPVADTVQTAAAALNVISGTFTDSRDGQVYRTVVIGTQTWMAENLNFVTDSSACYDNDDSNCTKYGRLYNWNDAMKACPAEWRVPSDAEWTVLTDLVGGREVAGAKLKSKAGWSADKGYKAATDDYGFLALPGGGGSGGSFYNAGNFGGWWSATDDDAGKAWARIMNHSNDGVRRYDLRKTSLYSVRCLRDSACCIIRKPDFRICC